jgi:Rad3-related DNA helicase
MFECPKCGKELTFVDNYFVIGVKCEKCLISDLKDNKSDLDISDEESYQNLLKKYNPIKDVEKNEEKNFSISMEEYRKVYNSTNKNIKEIEKGHIEEEYIDKEDVKKQLQDKKINLSVENNFIEDSLPSNTNPNQSEYFLEILRYVENSIKNGKKFIIVNAPTGIGKSHIAATLCKFLKEGVILTEQISLQLQYIQNFSWMNQVKGMSNFSCPDLEWEKTANFGNCESCKFRCDKDDFEIINEGTEQETVSVIQNSRFGGLPEEILHNEKNFDVIPEKEKTIIAENLLTQNELERQKESLNRFAIKYKNQFFFVLLEEKIPKESEVQRNNGQLIIRENEICPYYQQRMMGEAGSFAVYNYPMYISTMLGKSTDSEKTRPRQILICDEAHQLEDKLKDQGSIELDLNSINEIIDNKKIISEIKVNTVQKKFLPLISNLDQLLSILEKKYDEYRKHRACIKFLNSKMHVDKHRSDYCQKHKRTIKKCLGCHRLRKEMDAGKFLECNTHLSLDEKIECKENHSGFTEKYVKKIKEERKNLKSSIEVIKKVYKKFGDEQNNFVLQFDEDKNKIIIQPIQVSETAQTLFSNFNHVVFLSSTIHKEIFVKDMGIEDYDFKSFPNPIQPHNRIVKMWPSPLEKWEPPKIVNEQYRSIAQKIIHILNIHKNEKGLILVNSYSDLTRLLPFLDDIKSRLTYNQNKDDHNSPEVKNGELIKTHESKENSVLFSPSMWEGVDLKGDLGRFCIIATAPFMPLNEKRNPYGVAKNRLRGDQEWSHMRNAFKFVQGMGRCVRGTDDRSTTYVLDDGCKKHKNWLETYVQKDSNSKWFTDSIEDY